MTCTTFYLNGTSQIGKTEIAIGALKQINSLPHGRSLLIHETLFFAKLAKKRFDLQFDVTSRKARPHLGGYTAVAVEAWCGLKPGELEAMQSEMNDVPYPCFIIVVA